MLIEAPTGLSLPPLNTQVVDGCWYNVKAIAKKGSDSKNETDSKKGSNCKKGSNSKKGAIGKMGALTKKEAINKIICFQSKPEVLVCYNFYIFFDTMLVS